MADQPLSFETDFSNRTKEIALDEMSAADDILIQTKNSVYRFSILDPVHRRGKLSGGSFGDLLRDALLVGALAEDGKSFSADTSVLKTDSCALFYIDAGNGFRRLTTSVITSLVYVRGEMQPQPAAVWPLQLNQQESRK